MSRMYKGRQTRITLLTTAATLQLHSKLPPCSAAFRHEVLGYHFKHKHFHSGPITWPLNATRRQLTAPSSWSCHARYGILFSLPHSAAGNCTYSNSALPHHRQSLRAADQDGHEAVRGNGSGVCSQHRSQRGRADPRGDGMRVSATAIAGTLG